MANEPRDVFEEDEQREEQDRAEGGNDDFEIVYADNEEQDESESESGKDEKDDKGDEGEDAEDAKDKSKAGDADDEEGSETGDEGIEADAADESEEDEEDLSKYSRAVRKRVERERRIRRQAEDAVETERAARVAAQKENLATQQQFVDFMLTGFDQRIEALKSQLAAAKEAQDPEKEAELLVAISEANSKKRQAEEAKQRLSAVKIDDQPTISPEARRWMANNRWYNHPRFQAETAFVAQLDQRLSKEASYRPGSPEYMRELDRRIKDQLPDLRRRVSQVFGKPASKTTKPDGEKKRTTPTAAPVSRSAAPRQEQRPTQQRPDRIVLTREDQELMRTFKLDPSNREHVKEFAAQRRAQGGR